jgi:glycosyltransferase involved in cell wall biosynthesis
VSLGINDDSYFLCVGTLEPRKNIRFLVDAYVALPQHVKEKFSLVLAGGIGWKMADDITYIQTYVDNGERIVMTNYVSDTERQQLYEHARSFVMPSHYEGFGMPVLEAMVYGLPCAVNDIEVFRELCGESVTYFREIDELTQILIKYAESKQVIDYSQVIDQYNWQNVGDLLLQAMKD